MRTHEKGQTSLKNVSHQSKANLGMKKVETKKSLYFILTAGNHFFSWQPPPTTKSVYAIEPNTKFGIVTTCC